MMKILGNFLVTFGKHHFRVLYSSAFAGLLGVRKTTCLEGLHPFKTCKESMPNKF